MIYRIRTLLVLFAVITACILGVNIVAERAIVRSAAQDNRAHPDEAISTVRYSTGIILSFNLLAFAVILNVMRRAGVQQKRLQESEALFRTFFESSPAGMAITSPEGRFLRVNDSLQHLLGYSKEVLTKKSWQDITCETDVAYSQGLIRDLNSGEVNNVTAVNRYTHRDGATVWCQVAAAPVRDAAGQVAFHVATIEDITDIKNGEIQEQATSKLLRAVVQAADDLINSPDVDQLYRRAVEMAREKLGLDRCAIFIHEGQSIRGTYGTSMKGETTDERAYRPLLDEKWAERLKPLLPGDPKWRIAEEPLQEWNGNQNIEMKNGWIAITPIQSIRGPIGVFCNDCAISRRPINQTQQEIVAIYASILGNIIDRKRAEDGLRRMGMAVQQAAESITITDTLGNIEYVNPAFSQITGYTADEALGRSTRILKSGKQDAAFYERLWTALTRGEVWSGHFTNRRKDGTLYDAYQTISPIRDASGRVINYVSVSRDVTREMELESQFIQAQKMEGIGRLAGGIAHDFNNLLTAILGNGNLIKGQLGENNPISEELDEIIRAGERAAKLTKQLLSFARKQIVQLRPLRLNDIIVEMDKFLRRTLGEHIEVRTSLDEKLASISADSGLVEQLLMNLAVNARDAMPKGGVLEIRTANVLIEQPPRRARAEFRVGRYVVLTVRDTGCGMTDEVAKHVFEPFYTTKEVGKGTGLGLATVYGIVDQCKGHIEFDTKVGTGTEFRIFFPEAGADGESPSESSSVPMAKEGETILLVEDEEPVRNLTARILESLAYKVIVARHGREGLEIFQHMGHKIDLVITDVVMPQMGGPDLISHLRKLTHFRAAMYTSGFTAGTLLDHGLMDQEWVLLLKPYTREELARRVRESLDNFPRKKT